MEGPLQAFAKLVRLPEPELDLGRAALAIAEIEHPGLGAESHLARLDALAARSGVAREPAGRARLDRLSAFLFEQEGFRGNAEEYYDPRNSCLNDVLDRRLGIPITLSVLMMEVGRRVGLAIAGVGLPGHFVVGAKVDGAAVVIDPFGGGRALTRGDADALVSRVVGQTVNLTDAHFAPASKREIIVRMLLNLKGIYAHREDWGKTLAVLDRLLIVDGNNRAHSSERGTVIARYRRKLAVLN
jgi:regulator of sirC expression with transglutaminase-like and TPR domain